MLGASLPPCRRCYPAGGGRRFSQSATAPAAFAHNQRARPPRLDLFEATSAFTLVTAWWLAHHPMDGFANGLQSISFPPLRHSGYGAVAPTPVGLTPTERASLSLVALIVKSRYNKWLWLGAGSYS